MTNPEATVVQIERAKDLAARAACEVYNKTLMKVVEKLKVAGRMKIEGST